MQRFTLMNYQCQQSIEHPRTNFLILYEYKRHKRRSKLRENDMMFQKINQFPHHTKEIYRQMMIPQKWIAKKETITTLLESL